MKRIKVAGDCNLFWRGGADLCILKEPAKSASHYLEALANRVPNSTYQSHQTTLTKLVEWCCDMNIEIDGLQERSITEFIDFLLSEADLTVNTVSGHVCTLSNFISYLDRQDPEIVKAQIVFHLQQSGSTDLEIVGRRITSVFDNRPSSQAVEALLHYLRHRQFGTRTHAYIELLLDTRSRPEQVRQLTLTDLNLSDREVTIGIPDTHLVSAAGLVTERHVDLAETTVESVESYIQYERDDSSLNTCRPVFTTTQGRASATTLCRSVQQMSETATNSLALQCPSGTDLDEVATSSDQSQPLGPQDIWQHALATIPDH